MNEQRLQEGRGKWEYHMTLIVIVTRAVPGLGIHALEFLP